MDCSTNDCLYDGLVTDGMITRAIEKHRPLRSMISLTRDCNFYCPMCCVRTDNRSNEISARQKTASEWIWMCEQLRNAGIISLTLTGGEPLMHPQFIEIYEAVYQMGFQISLKTNASLVTGRVAELFHRFPPHFCSVSIYGGSNETYAAFTGRDCSLDAVMHGVTQLQSAKVLGSLVYTIIKKNVFDLQKVFDIANSVRWPLSFITDIVPHLYIGGIHREDVRLSPAERVCLENSRNTNVDKILREAVALEKELCNWREKSITRSSLSKYNICYGSLINSLLDWDGRMRVCSQSVGFSVDPFKVGFEDAWEQLKKSRKTQFPSSACCENCEDKQFCDNNCPSRFLVETGSNVKPPRYTCQTAFLRRRYKESRLEGESI